MDHNTPAASNNNADGMSVIEENVNNATVPSQNTNSKLAHFFKSAGEYDL